MLWASLYFICYAPPVICPLVFSKKPIWWAKSRFRVQLFGEFDMIPNDYLKSPNIISFFRLLSKFRGIFTRLFPSKCIMWEGREPAISTLGISRLFYFDLRLLTSLNISDNGMIDEQGEHLGQLLFDTSLPLLERLDLSRNSLTAHAVRKILKCLFWKPLSRGSKLPQGPLFLNHFWNKLIFHIFLKSLFFKEDPQ